MEAKRSIRSYIGVGAALPLAALLALLAAVVCLSFALRGVLASDQVQEYAPFSTREAMSGSIYLDVLGISEPLHSEEGRAFYVAESAEHEYCLVCLARTSLDELGAQHMRDRTPIVYTSGDSVFQIACHEELFPPDFQLE